MANGTVYNIMRYSIHDGPGIRTTVFLKGCPLRCAWCHNPEGISPKPEPVFFANRCIGCGDCVPSCPHGAISARETGFETDTRKCVSCGKCAEACPAASRELVGREYTPGELLTLLERDRVFYDESGGGVTFSGGEPLAQPEFLVQALRLCAEAGLHTAVDTCGFAREDVLRAVLPHTDLFLFDLKHMDSASHQKYTGQPNERIISNLRLLAREGARVWARLPIIPGVNDNEAHVRAAGELINEIGGVERVSLLPFHNISGEKYKRLGLPNPMKGETDMDRDALAPLAEMLRDMGVRNVANQ